MLCFAILAHQNEEALLKQVRNIRKYNGNHVQIVLYNGGTNKDFGKKICQSEGVKYCTYSRPLKPRMTGRFFYDVMRWLEEKKVSYDYLVYTESDVLFVSQGFEKLLDREMKGFDCTGRSVRYETAPRKSHWKPGRTLWKEWDKWKPFFKSDRFYGTFNPMQVYRHSIIKRMLARIDKRQLEELFKTTKVFALGEILYITLAVLCNGKCKEYPSSSKKYLRLRNLTLAEAKDAIRKPQVLFVHPVKDASVRNYICSI